MCVGSINCATSASPCQSCIAGFQLNSGQCVDQSMGCQTFGSSDSQGVCIQCKNGYKMIGYQCIQNSIFVPYCYVYSSNSSCQICKNGYSLFQSYCLLSKQIQAVQLKTKMITMATFN